MHSRRNRRKKKHSQSIIWLLLGTSLLAVACGWGINTLLVKNYLWAPVVNRPNPDDPGQQTGGGGTTPPVVPAIESAEITLGGFTVFRVQVSALSTEDKAQALITKLNTQGYPASYLFDAGSYKVSAGLYADKAAAQAAGELLGQLGYQVWVRESGWSGGAYAIRGELAPYIAAAAEPVAMIEAALGQLLSAEQMTPTQASSLKDDVDAAGQALSMLKPPASATQAHSALIRSSALILSAVTELCQYVEGQGDQELMRALGSLMEFINIYPGWTNGIQNLLK